MTAFYAGALNATFTTTMNYTEQGWQRRDTKTLVYRTLNKSKLSRQ